MGETLTGTTTLGQSELGSNANEGEFQNWNLTIRCYLVLYIGIHCLDGRGSYPSTGDPVSVFKAYSQNRGNS